MRFGEAIKQLREHNGLSQAAWAEKIGVSVATAHNWEHRTEPPNSLAWHTLTEKLKQNRADVPKELRGTLLG